MKAEDIVKMFSTGGASKSVQVRQAQNERNQEALKAAQKEVKPKSK